MISSLADRIEATAALLAGSAREGGMLISGDGRVGEADAAALLGVHRDTLRAWRCAGNGPDHFRIGGSITYRPGDLAAFIEVGRTSAGAGAGR